MRPLSSTDVARHLIDGLHLDLEVDAAAELPIEDWRATGLAGPGAPTNGDLWRARGRPATTARGASTALAAVARDRFGVDVAIDGARLLGQRSALATDRPPTADGRVSRGGAARLLRAGDAWWALNLARPTDAELVPALVEQDTDSTWTAVERWSAERSAQEAVERAVLLDMPAARLGEVAAPDQPWLVRSTPATPSGGPQQVVSLGALWAGPLAAHLLGLLGLEVVHVESAGRPDASRWGDPGLYEALRTGAEVRTIDFASDSGRRELRDLLDSATIVVEASRPRALEALRVAPGDVMADGRSRTWVQITGYGPTQPDRVAFGDDASIAGGLVVLDDAGDPAFYGDAVADPLTGLLAALAVAATHDHERATLLQVSLAGAAAYSLLAGDLTP